MEAPSVLYPEKRVYQPSYGKKDMIGEEPEEISPQEEIEKLYEEIEKLSEELEALTQNHTTIKNELTSYLEQCGYSSIQELILVYREEQIVTLPEQELEGILNLEINKPRVLERLLVFARMNQKPKV